MTKINEALRERILAMFDAGSPRNAIARELDIAGSTVTRVCRDAGREFDRAQTLMQLRAERLDIEEERTLVAKKLLLVANDVLDTLEDPHLVHNFGGKDNTYAEHVLDEAPLSAKLDAVRTAGLAFDKATRLIERTPGGLDEVHGILDTLAEGFAAAAEQIRAQEAAGAGDAEQVTP